MGTLKVNGAISATGTISASSFLGNASSATYTCQFRISATNPCTASTDLNTGIFNVPDSRIYWISQTGTVIDQLSQQGYILDIGNNAERHQIWMTQSSGDMAHRGGNTSGWRGTWRVLLDSSNYTSYVPTKTGSGASGTWGINVTGSAGSVAWGNITGKPSLMPASPGSIELFPGSSAGHGGFIDFHYNNSSSDYTARLINQDGRLEVDGATLNVGGKVELWTDNEGGNLRLTSPGGNRWSIDALNNSSLRFIWEEASVPITFGSNGTIVANYLQGTAQYANIATASNSVTSTGFGHSNFTYLQTDGDFYGASNWSHYLIANHGDGASYFNYVIRLPFWSSPQYKYQTGSTSAAYGWYNFHTTENVKVQSSQPTGQFVGQIWLKI